MSDHQLVEKCIQGDQDSFAELVHRYKKLIYYTVYYYIKDREEVNDVAQEVFVKIYKSLNRYNSEYNFSTWSVAIAKNLCVDIIRKKKLKVTNIDEYESLTRDDDTPERQYLSKERAAQVHKAIENLPEKYRTLIILYHQHGLSYKEMAERLNKPLSIIKNRLHRARVTLRESMLKCG
jgi:RNA polymerase sigma-70 factor (ECF subfamily)